MSQANGHRRVSGRLVLATHNLGKLRELRELMAPYGVALIGAGELGLAEPEETGASFAANARLKAQAACNAAGLPSLADDSGLCVDALGGQPGIYSARWAGQPADFAKAMRRVESELREARAPAPWRAHFVSALCVAWPDGHCEEFEDRVDGELIFPPRGEQGFGYDPIFRPDGYALGFGQMSAAQKHSIPADGSRALSHRARAFQALARACLA